MTIPLERSRAVLWAGGLLVALNGDRRVPMEHRRAATQIARHFPTVEDVSSASHLRLFGRDEGMFENPRDCVNWREGCPGKPLTWATRLHWPSEDADDGIEDGGADDEADSSVEGLEAHLAAVDRAQDALTRRRQRLAYLCRDAHPVLIVCFHVLGWDLKEVIEWTNRLQFDDNTKNVAHLLIEDRGDEINERLRQLTHENPVKWHPLD